MLLGVCGKPIVHSASPILHKSGLISCGLSGESVRLICETASEALVLANKLGLRGLNVTAPFKEEIAELTEELSEEAREIAAVNTVVFDAGHSKGYNTDIFGVEQAVLNLTNRLKLADGNKLCRAVILGAGGAAKAAAKALQNLGISFSIVSRSAARANSLAGQFAVKAFLFSEVAGQKQVQDSDLIINCLASLEMPFPASLISARQFVLDSHYKAESEIIRSAKSIRSKTANGYGWLICQSQKSQELFFLNKPKYEDLERAIKAKNTCSKTKSVALVGLMGSGKSVVAKELSTSLGLRTIDLDKEIELEAKLSIAELFASAGEEAFRDLESKVLRRISAESDSRPYVLACGGGVVIKQENIDILNSSSKVVWLWVSPKQSSIRLKNADNRPLLSMEDKKQALENLLRHRKLRYAQVADLVIDTDSLTEKEVSDRIYAEIK